MKKVHAIPNTGFSRSYIIEGRSGLVAVDGGSKGSAEDIVAYMMNILGRELRDIRFITATHYHIDHIGGIRYLLEQCHPDTRVLFHYMVRDYLSGTRKISLIHNWFSGLMPATIVSGRYVRRVSHLFFGSLAGVPLPGIRVFTGLPFSTSRISFFGGGVLHRYPLGFEEWEVIETPGHTEDSICFFNEGTGEFISGDLIINVSKRGMGHLNRFCWRRDVIRKSYERLCKDIHPGIIYPGHGEVIETGEDALTTIETF
jgi:glyoxylase-like metal-dependent hydrolase (beta-lactamase superfamily II)